MAQGVDESGRFRDQLLSLNRIGIALTSTTNLEELLELVVLEARKFTRADAGTIYLVEREPDGTEVLHFRVTQCDTLARRNNPPWDRGGLTGFKMPITQKSVAGYCAITGEILSIPDVYHLPPESTFTINRSFDEKNHYKTRSMMLVPLKNPAGKVIGVLQLINAMDGGGAVTAFPRDLNELIFGMASQSAVAIQNTLLTTQLKAAYLDTIHRLAVAAEFRDNDTAAHIMRMSNYSALIAKRLRMTEEEIEVVRYASPMHDVGKIGISDLILLKPGKLTDEEFEEMKKHPIIGAKILEGAHSEPLITSEVIALTHHEKFDGTGYPRGLKGEQIPMVGRIVALADVYDALTSQRCYKPAFPNEKALAIIREGSGKHFDPQCVDAFLDIVDQVLEVKATYSG
ncbi:MAG: HD domain-containing protein [Planctomycetes bacterium]|nr:HD domain-containing protein [Planctomycetota bacterium]